MEGMLFKQIMSVVIPWAFAFIAGVLLLRYNRENKNPLEWSTVDRCLLLIALFCFMGGASNLVIGISVSMYFESLPWANWTIVQSYYEINRIVGLPWVILVLIGLWLRKRSPESRAFAHTVIQLNAIHISLVSYTFGPVTHPGAFLLSMSIGIFIFLLFETSIALPWMATVTVLLVVSTIATWMGLIPYAPLYTSSPFQDGKIDIFYLVGTMAVVMTIFLLMLLLIAYIFARWRDREKKVAEMTGLLKKMFGRYLSTEVMNSLIENPSSLELGGERRKVTIMMTDLRGFTSLSERLEPEQVLQMLNSYFEVMVDVILQYHGTINEIIGDALLVIFGAPQEMPDQTQQAIACAIAMQNAMAEVNKENRTNGLPKLEMGIGLNETEVIVGNVGSSKRSKYAAVGSGVNMTSRIESYSVGGQILISDSVLKEAGEILRIDAQREVLPKGAEMPLKIYEVGGIAGNYNLSLDKKDPDFVSLLRKIPLRYTILGGKHIGKEGLDGLIVRLSKKSAEIHLKKSIELLSNLKMNLVDADEELSSKDFYGKVIESAGENGRTQMVRFTSIPPEINAYFHSHRQHAVSNK